MLADERLRGEVHRFGVEFMHHMPDAALVERGRGAAAEDAIKIMARRSRKAGMEIGRGNRRFHNGDGRRPHEMVQRVADFVGRELFFKIEMRHLAEGVHAGIGAPGAGDRDALAAKFEDRLFQSALHRRAVVLALPADERRSVIFDGEAIARHQTCREDARQARSRAAIHSRS